MDVENSQKGDDDNDKYLARLCEIYFPSSLPHHTNQQQQQQQEQQANTYQASVMDLAEYRRHLMELYEMKTQQHHQQQMILQQMYWPQMQQVKQIVQNPHQIINSNDAQTNKAERKKKEAAYLVAAGNLEGADEWAWRKYGQKPIKGCTYPRSYYKCSSSKGCNAKKQVEKILVDPDIYMVSYKGEHTHMDPVQPILLPGSVLDSISCNPVSEMPQTPTEISPEMVTEAAMEEGKNKDSDKDKDKVEEDLLIPNLMMVDQDMLTSMEQLKWYYTECNNSGHHGSGSTGGLNSK